MDAAERIPPAADLARDAGGAGPQAMTCLAAGLHFPTSLAFDGAGGLFVAESGLPFGGAPPGGRVLRINGHGRAETVLDGLRAPVNGLTWHRDRFLIAEGGFPGRISAWTPGGKRRTLIDGLPGRGNYHTNMVVPGPDDWLYFGQGAMTNSGVVGLDAYDLAWLKQLPHPCDRPGYPIATVAQAFETDDPGTPDGRARTLPFAPFGAAAEGIHAHPTEHPAALPCTAAIMRMRADGSDLEVFAWGLRNAYGLGFLPDGRLLATDQGPDDRGSRPIGQAPDCLYAVERGRWYGWPDFVGGRPVIDPAFAPTRGPAPRFLLADHAALPPPQAPLFSFAVNAAATKFAVLPSGSPWPGQIVVALFGDEKPMTAPTGARVGRGLLRLDPRDWSARPFPAGPFARPIDIVPTPDGRGLMVVDFGHFEMLGHGRIEAGAGSGRIWHVAFDGRQS